MKAQFKYSFLNGVHARIYVFAVIFLMHLVFLVFAAFGALPLPAQITAVSLSGTAIAVMAIVNVISDVSIIRQMFGVPKAYLYALTPVPRKKALLANVIAMLVMDVVTMAVSIFGVTLLSLNLASNYQDDLWMYMREGMQTYSAEILYAFWFIALGIASYLLVMTFIIFCVTLKRSVFYQKSFGRALTVLLSLGVLYIFNLSQFALAPFSNITRWGMFFTLWIGGGGIIAWVILLLIQAAALFVVTSKLMERKLNI